MPRPRGTFPFESAARQSLAQFAKDTGSRVDSARVSVPKFGRSEGSKAAWAARSSKKSDSSTLLQKLNFADSFPQTERESIYKYCKAAVTHQSGDYYEDLSILRMDGSLVGQTSSKVRNETQYSRTLNAAVKSAEPYTLVSLHNHGTNVPPSGADFGSAGEKNMLLVLLPAMTERSISIVHAMHDHLRLILSILKLTFIQNRPIIWV